MDSWSCGLFTMMAMQAYTQGISFELVEDSQKDGMRRRALSTSYSVVRETSPRADVDDITEPIIYDEVQHMHDLPTSTPSS